MFSFRFFRSLFQEWFGMDSDSPLAAFIAGNPDARELKRALEAFLKLLFCLDLTLAYSPHPFRFRLKTLNERPPMSTPYPYPTDLTDAQWQRLSPFLPSRRWRRGGRVVPLVLCVWFSMVFSIELKPAVSGRCYRRRLAPGKQCMDTSIAGGKTDTGPGCWTP